MILTDVGKVTQISETANVSARITKQDITIADPTGAVKIDIMGGGHWSSSRRYHLLSFKHDGSPISRMSKEGGIITQYDVDIGEVADNDGEVDTTIHATEVASVITLESNAACNCMQE